MLMISFYHVIHRQSGDEAGGVKWVTYPTNICVLQRTTSLQHLPQPNIYIFRAIEPPGSENFGDDPRLYSNLPGTSEVKSSE